MTDYRNRLNAGEFLPSPPPSGVRKIQVEIVGDSAKLEKELKRKPKPKPRIRKKKT